MGLLGQIRLDDGRLYNKNRKHSYYKFSIKTKQKAKITIVQWCLLCQKRTKIVFIRPIKNKKVHGNTLPPKS